MTTPVGLTAESEALRDASLGMRLREYRKKEGLTLREAAKRAGISHSHLSKVETGRDWATDRTVRLLAAVYDAEPDMLLMDRNIDRVPYIVRRAIEAAAVARHVRETGCEGLREALDAVAHELHRWHANAWLKPAFEDCASPYCFEARAALAYLLVAAGRWPMESFKPRDFARDVERGGALAAAALDGHDLLAPAADAEQEGKA